MLPISAAAAATAEALLEFDFWKKKKNRKAN